MQNQRPQMMQQGVPMKQNAPMLNNMNSMQQMGMNQYLNMNSQISNMNSMSSMYQPNSMNQINPNNSMMQMNPNMNSFPNQMQMNMNQFSFANQMNIPQNIPPATNPISSTKSKKPRDQTKNANQQQKQQITPPTTAKKRGPKPRPKVASIPQPPSGQPPTQSIQSQIADFFTSQSIPPPPVQPIPPQQLPSQPHLSQSIQSQPSLQQIQQQTQPISMQQQSIPSSQTSIPLQAAQTLQFQSSISIPQSSQQIQKSTSSDFKQLASNTLQSIQSHILNSNFGFQNQQLSNDKKRLKEAISQMSEDKQDLFHRLFDNSSKRNKDDRNDSFVDQIYTSLLQINANSFNYLLTLINFFNDDISNIKNPPLPLLFRRIKGRKPIYKFVALEKKGFDIQPKFKDKQGDFGIIGSFYCFTESLDPVPIIINKKEVEPIHFGTKEYYYPISREENIPSKIHISFGTQAFPFLTVFIIRYVELRDSVEILHNLMAKAGIPIGEQAPVTLSQAPSFASFQSMQSIPSFTQDQRIYAKTETCRDACSFPLLEAIKEILTNGSAECPKCKSLIILNELSLEVGQEKVKEPKEIELPDETPEMKLALQTLSTCLCSQLVPQPFDPNWEEKHYGECGVQIDPHAKLMQYKTTEEYLAEIDGIS